MTWLKIYSLRVGNAIPSGYLILVNSLQGNSWAYPLLDHRIKRKLSFSPDLFDYYSGTKSNSSCIDFLDTPRGPLLYPEKYAFSLEITMKTDLRLPKVKDVYITMLPGNDFREVANKAKELVQSGFNLISHFPARSIKNSGDLKDYVSMCKDFGVKQALVIGGSAEPIGDYHCSLQILETGLFDGFKIGIKDTLRDLLIYRILIWIKLLKIRNHLQTIL